MSGGDLHSECKRNPPKSVASPPGVEVLWRDAGNQKAQVARALQLVGPLAVIRWRGNEPLFDQHPQKVAGLSVDASRR